ncbi:MAG: outer membrane protein transport protein [Desulforegulaceae bacterium]|nr:outer membrane protein transport protein [Desulforegulaceae bacterium]
MKLLSPKTKNMRIKKLLITIVLVLFLSKETLATFNENPAIDARALGLANACTASPPGHMSAHFNPAGLSKIDEGAMFSNGFGIPIIKRKGSFKENKDFKGFMGDKWGPNAEPNINDPDSNHGGPDPLRNTKGTNSSTKMYIPFLGPIDFLAAVSLGLSHRKPDSKWTFAYTNYAPYGGGMTHNDPGDPLRFGCKSLYLQHLIYAAPTLSYKASDQLSLGISVGFGQTAMGISLDQRTPNELVGLTRVIGDATRDLEIPVVSQLTLPAPWLGGGLGPYEHNTSMEMDLRDDFTPSVNLGLLWEPTHWFGFGLSYQSQAKAKLSGKYKFTYSEQWQRQIAWNGSTEYTMTTAGMLDMPYKAVPSQTGRVTATQLFPRRIDMGIKLKPWSKIQITADLHWSNWAALKEDKFTFDQRIQLFRIAKLLGYTGGDNNLIVKREMEDTWHWGVGLEVYPKDWLTLRCGYEFRPASLPKDKIDALYFLPDMTFYAAGFSLHLPKNVTLDFGFGYLFNDSLKVPNNSSTNMNSTDFTKIVYNPYAGLDYEQETYLYIALFGVTMPLSVQMEMLHHQQEMLHHAAGKVKKFLKKLNPFKKDKKVEKDQINHENQI